MQTVATSRIGPLGPSGGMSIERFVAMGNGQLKLLARMGAR
jgi:succinate-semialdehyde dehydrogenase/glutarate-semialdehyde dehydrogenase